MKTYTHDVMQSRARCARLRKQAETVAAWPSNEWFAEYNLLQLQYVGEHGVPSCYEDAFDFLCDFWPDLPWDGPSQAATARLMLQDARFPAIVEAVKESIDIDMHNELSKALKPLPLG